jgi:hypothetical protein
MQIDLRSRAIAALIHAFGTIAVALLAAALVFLLWYPWPYSALAGGTGLFVLLTGVDVVIGPLVTFVIFDRAKGWPVLRRDLAVILLLQAGALLYGLHVVFEARPVALALEGQRMRVISAVDVVVEELPEAPPGLRSLPLGGPRLIDTAPPADPGERLAATRAALEGVDLGQRPKYWRPWDAEARRSALAASRPLEPLIAGNTVRREELQAALARTGRAPADLRYLPLLARRSEWVALIDAHSGEVAGFAPFVGD